VLGFLYGSKAVLAYLEKLYLKSHPVPIPNREVKPVGADGTARVAAWESRKSPGLINKKPVRVNSSGLFVFCKRNPNTVG
jgi:hypothetical protein